MVKNWKRLELISTVISVHEVLSRNTIDLEYTNGTGLSNQVHKRWCDYIVEM